VTFRCINGSYHFRLQSLSGLLSEFHKRSAAPVSNFRLQGQRSHFRSTARELFLCTHPLAPSMRPGRLKVVLFQVFDRESVWNRTQPINAVGPCSTNCSNSWRSYGRINSYIENENSRYINGVLRKSHNCRAVVNALNPFSYINFLSMLYTRIMGRETEIFDPVFSKS